MNNIIQVSKTGISGEGRCILYNNASEMKIIKDTGWFRNKIVDTGLDLFTTSNWWAYTYIGDGTTAPVAGDTAMESFLGYSNTVGNGNGVKVIQVAPNWEYSEVKSRRFNAGVGTGTISEIGMGTNIVGTSLFNRQLITPAPIVKADVNVLDVLFRITIWPSLGEVINQITITEFDVPILYDTITKYCLAAQTFNTSVFVAAGIATVFTPYVYDGDLGLTPESGPQGVSLSVPDGYNLAYTPGSYIRQVKFDWGLNSANISSGLGIRSMFWRSTKGSWSTQFNGPADERIPKDNERTMSLTAQMSWAEYTP